VHGSQSGTSICQVLMQLCTFAIVDVRSGNDIKAIHNDPSNQERNKERLEIRVLRWKLFNCLNCLKATTDGNCLGKGWTSDCVVH